MTAEAKTDGEGSGDAREGAAAKQDRKLARALGKLFTAAAANDGRITIGKPVVNALNKIVFNDTLTPLEKCQLFDTILTHVVPAERALLAVEIYTSIDDPVIDKFAATRAYAAIDAVPDEDRYSVAAMVIGAVPAPSPDGEKKVVETIDTLRPGAQFDYAMDLYPHFEDKEIILSKVIDTIPYKAPEERYALAMSVFPLTPHGALENRVLEEALRAVPFTPAEERTHNAVEIYTASANKLLKVEAIEAAARHARVANADTMSALAHIIADYEEEPNSLLSRIVTPERMAAVEYAYYLLSEQAPAKPAPLQPQDFVAKMQAMPAPTL